MGGRGRSRCCANGHVASREANIGLPLCHMFIPVSQVSGNVCISVYQCPYIPSLVVPSSLLICFVRLLSSSHVVGILKTLFLPPYYTASLSMATCPLGALLLQAIQLIANAETQKYVHGMHLCCVEKGCMCVWCERDKCICVS